MSDKETSNTLDWRRSLAAGALALICVASVLFISLRSASSALNSWNTILAFLASLPLAIIAIWLPGLRLACLAGPPATNAASFWANALSVLFSLVTPGRLFETVKPIALNLQTGLPLARGFAAVAVERLLDIKCLVLLATLAIVSAAAQYTEGLREAMSVLTALLGLGFIFVVALAGWPLFAQRLARALPFGWLQNPIDEMLETVTRVRNWRLLATASLYSLLTWTASYLIFFVFMEFIGAVALSPTQVLFVFVVGTLGLTVTVTPGGLGTYESAIVLALGGFGFPVSDALAIAILLRITNILPAVAASVWFLANSSWAIDDLLARFRAGRDTKQ